MMTSLLPCGPKLNEVWMLNKRSIGCSVVNFKDYHCCFAPRYCFFLDVAAMKGAYMVGMLFEVVNKMPIKNYFPFLSNVVVSFVISSPSQTGIWSLNERPNGVWEVN